MLKSTRFRVTPLIVAILLQILATECGPSGSPVVPSKLARQSPIRPNESKRLVPAGKGTRQQLKGGSSAKRNEPKEGRKEDLNRKFQARMMSEADQAAQQQQQQSASIKRQDIGPGGGSDTWQTHPLVPTFTDQEQGDEMVALASDQYEQDEIRLPRANRSMPMGGSKQVANKVEQSNQQRQPSRSTDKLSSEATANKARLNLQDEYEGDDEDDVAADDEPGRLSPVAGEYEPVQGRDSNNRELQPSQTSKFKPPSQATSGLEYTDYVPQQYDQSNKMRHLDQAANRSATNNLVRPVDSGWLPTASSSPASNELQSQPQLSTVSKSPEISRERAPSAGDRLAGFFGGREAFNKADVAIEYLRNMLKNKQSQLSSSNTTRTTHWQEYSDNLRNQNQETKPERISSFDRISLLTSRLNKILNSTIAQTATTNSTSEQASKLSIEPNSAEQSFKQQFDQARISTQIASAADLTSGQKTTRQSGTKFSISDAKSAAAQLEQRQQQQQQQQQQQKQPVQSLASTKLPFDPFYSPEPSQTGPVNQPFKPSQNQPSDRTIYSDQVAALLTLPANGTPLGGDYFEGLDDYPRYSQEQQQQQQQAFSQQRSPSQLQESQSQLAPIRQDPPKVEGSSDTNLHQNYPAPAQPPAQTNQSPPPTHQELAPVNMPEHLFNLQQQRDGPRSSRFFQMHQTQNQDNQEQPTSRQTPVVLQPPQPKQESDTKPSSIQASRSPNSQRVVSQNIFPQDQVNHSDSAPLFARPNRYEETREHSLASPQKPIHLEADHTPLSHQAVHQEQQILHRPPSTVSQQTISSSKIYANSEPQAQVENPGRETKYPREVNLQLQQQQQQVPTQQATPTQINYEQPPVAAQRQHQEHSTKSRPPKIVSYNYFESPSEAGKESELIQTNYQLADALYSSTGELGHMLSNTELEAIQGQFLTAEHPVVPVLANDHQARQFNDQHHPADQSLAGLLANLKPEDYQPAALQQLGSPPAQHSEETLKELASNDQQISALPPAAFHKQHQNPRVRQSVDRGDELSKLLSKPLESGGKKHKSLIVYLNHPRPVDMSKPSSGSDGYNLAESVSDQPLESFISAKEFDTQGLSKDTKHLDVSSLRGLGDSKEGQDKDGVSVVVIGDAYKYKKIVLLISSKSGGLKFIPMVKDMKK